MNDKFKGHSWGQGEHASSFILYDVLLNIESELECESFSRDSVQYSLTIVVSQCTAHLVIGHMWFIFTRTPQPRNSLRVDYIEFIVVSCPLYDTAVVWGQKQV